MPNVTTMAASECQATSEAPSIREVHSIHTSLEAAHREISLLEERLGHVLLPDSSSPIDNCAEDCQKSILMGKLDGLASSVNELQRRVNKLIVRIDV